MPDPNPARIPFLDGIRGYAALWVMLGHFSTRAGLRVPILESPGIAVDLFMVVSGFLMTQHYFSREPHEPWASPRTWILFYVRRFFRIAPLYYALLIPSFLAFDFLNAAQREPLKMLVGVDFQRSGIVDAGNVLTHISFLFGLIPQYCTILTMPDWSIGLEMQFYAVFPFFMLLARRWNMFRFCLFGLGAWGLFRKLSGLARIFAMPSFLPLSLGPFLVGMLLAWAWMQEKGRLTARASALLLLMAVTASLAQDQTKSAATGAMVSGISVLLAFLFFYEEESMGLGIERGVHRVAGFLGNTLARFLADVSYGVYLLHMLVMVPVLAMLCKTPAFVQQRAPIRFAILTMIAGALTYGGAWILFRVIEMPGIRIGKALVASKRFTKS